MRRAVGAVGAIIAAAAVIERLKALNSADVIHYSHAVRSLRGAGSSSFGRFEAFCLNCKAKQRIYQPQI